MTLQKRRSEVMGADWAHLPGDLLIYIAMKLICVEDLFSFFAVCSNWNAVANPVKSKWHPALPWLMTPDNEESPISCNWTVFDLSRSKSCEEVDIPDSLGWCCCCRGDGGGWVFTVGPDVIPCLFNPLTRACLSLPPAHTLLSLMEAFADCIDWMDEIAVYPNLMEEGLSNVSTFRSVTLVKNSTNNGFLVLVLSGFHRFAFAEPGSSAWYSTEEFDAPTLVMDVIGYNGQVMVLFGDGKLIGTSVDSLLHRDNNKSPTFEEYVTGDIHGRISITVDPIQNMCLVESCGDLLLVLRYTQVLCSDHDLEDFVIIDYETTGFKVFKLDSEAKGWVRVKDLRDVTLFVGNCSAVAVCSSNAECKSNCIYFTDDKPEESKFAGYDAGIFHLCDRSIEELDLGDDLPKLSSPFWLMPRLV